MDKRKESNLRVKGNITRTLFTLMQTKSLSEITITELVEGAGVARASFYRNYCSKEDVLVTLIRDVLDDFRKEDSARAGEFLYLRKYSFDLSLFSYLPHLFSGLVPLRLSIGLSGGTEPVSREYRGNDAFLFHRKISALHVHRCPVQYGHRVAGKA